MWGVRQVKILAVVILITLVLSLALSGCSKSCKSEKVYEKRPVTQTIETYADELYVVQENKMVGENCIERHYSELNNSRFNISIGEKEWLGQPPIPGETNYVRRVVNIFNARDEIDTVYLDKIYLYNGTETKRSKFPMKFLVDPKSIRTLYVMWDTQYDPLKDVTVEFTNNTKQLGFETTVARLCLNLTEKVNVTKTRKVLTGSEEEVTGYEDVVKVKLKRNC